jgi:RNA polymerase sigma-70 factor (ECF subfamily)
MKDRNDIDDLALSADCVAVVVAGDASVCVSTELRESRTERAARMLRESRTERAARMLREADPDREVLALIERGEVRTALRCAMARHGEAVYRYCRGALHDAALAEDVQQQVFIEAYRDLPHFDGRSTVRTWLFAIARHRVLDAAKARARTHARIELDNFADAADPRAAADDLLDDQQLRDLVAACIDELDENVRTALLLRYQQGFTFEQMAVICGEKAGTLQVRVARALPILRARMRLRSGGAF